MARYEFTPVDEIGVPLPIAPPEMLLPKNSPEADWHHHMHPKRDPRLDDVGGFALRNARIQLSSYDTHHNRYHREFFGPPIPDTAEEKFGLTVLLAAGYLPNGVIDFRKRKTFFRQMRPDEKQRFWASGEMRIGSETHIRNFLTEYTLAQDISHVDDWTVDEFLYTEDPERKRFLGHWLLAQAIEKATEPISGLYEHALKKERLGADKPTKVASLVAVQLGNVRRRDTLLPQLEQKLVAA
jgi:hypothetical protein